jgi:TRAP-type C4-dicarboxylate transport system permease small subunit
MLKIFEKYDKSLMIFFLINAVAAISLQVLSRFSRISFSWSQEYATFCFVWLIFIGVPLVYKDDAHIKILVFYDRFPIWLKKVSFGVNKIVVLATTILLIKPAYEYAVKGLYITTPAMGIPTFYVDIVIFIMFASILFQEFKKIYNKFRNKTNAPQIE